MRRRHGAKRGGRLGKRMKRMKREESDQGKVRKDLTNQISQTLPGIFENQFLKKFMIFLFLLFFLAIL